MTSCVIKTVHLLFSKVNKLTFKPLYTSFAVLDRKSIDWEVSRPRVTKRGNLCAVILTTGVNEERLDAS